ncbi:MAG: hypothetical protein JOZ16_03665, partial [Methylobacteriaceae bacterium]|nr:hypothetical protein [Methylobacteriaceae bacterium]
KQSREEETEEGQAKGGAVNVALLKTEHERNAEAGRGQGVGCLAAPDRTKNCGNSGERPFDRALDVGRRPMRGGNHLLQAAEKAGGKEGGATKIDGLHCGAFAQMMRRFNHVKARRLHASAGRALRMKTARLSPRR